METNDNSAAGPTGTRMSREPQLWLLVLLCAGAYLPRLDYLTIRGEETRRARVAYEMLESGDWIVPRQQGEVYLSRPPLGNWLIALVGIIRGQIDLVAVRLPSAWPRCSPRCCCTPTLGSGWDAWAHWWPD